MEHTLPERLSVSTDHLRNNMQTIMAKVGGGGAVVTLTTYRKPVAVLVNTERLEHLERLESEIELRGRDHGFCLPDGYGVAS